MKRLFSGEYWMTWVLFFVTLSLGLYLMGGLSAFLVNLPIVLLGISLVLGFTVVARRNKE